MAQRRLMMQFGMPGCSQNACSLRGTGPLPAIGGEVTAAHRAAVGSTTVCKVDRDGNAIAFRIGKVVTWPQLFLLGALQNFTAHEIFCAGMLLERVMTSRVRPWKNDLNAAVDARRQYEQNRRGTWGRSAAWSPGSGNTSWSYGDMGYSI
jgi:hypothetical protein